MNSKSSWIKAVGATLFVLALAGCAAAPATAPAQHLLAVENGLLPDGAFPPWVQAGIPERLAHYQIPGLSIAVFDDYRLAWARGYGVADALTKRPVTAETLFPAVGNSSVVSGYLAMILTEAGHLNPEEEVNRRLKTWRIPENEHTARQKVTLKMLLAYNSAGLVDFPNPGYEREAPCPALLQILEGASPATNPPVRVISRPGRFRGGENAFLVSQIVLEQLLTDVENRPFPEIAWALLFRPLGLTASTFEQPLPEDLQAFAASCHEKGAPIPGQWRIYPERAAMGLWTTPSEMARLLIEVCKSYRGLSGRLVSRATATKFASPGRHGFRTFSNAAGCESDILYNPATGQGAVIMMNGFPGSIQLKDEILHSLFKHYRWTWGSDLIWNDTFTQGWMLTAVLALAGLIGLLFAGYRLLARRA